MSGSSSGSSGSGRFAGRVAVITGGGPGLGGAFGAALAAEGARVALLDADERAALDTAAALHERGLEVFGVRCDVTNDSEVDSVVREVHDRWGRIDILINNAALHRAKYNQPFTKMDRSDVRAMFDVNVMGIINCSVACHPMLAASGHGAIVNIASTAGHISSTPYGVSKIAARGVTVALASEFGPDNIRVNAISPGFVGSAGSMADLSEHQLMAMLASQNIHLPRQVLDKCTTDDLAKIFLSLQPLAQEGTMHDVVQAMLYLCSDDAAFVSGETIRVAGGSANGF